MPRPLIATATLKRLAALNSRAMQTTAIIRRTPQPLDAGGAPVVGLPSTTPPVPCLFWARSPGQVGTDEPAGRRVPRGEYGCEFPLGTGIAVGNEVVVGGHTLVVVWAPPADAYTTAVTVGLSAQPPEA
jgi:hypothetical protein